jgi:hypothetical protein
MEFAEEFALTEASGFGCWGGNAMRKLVLFMTAASFLAVPAVMAAPIPSAGVTAVSSDDGLIIKTASHKNKNMKKVHKSQGGAK